MYNFQISKIKIGKQTLDHSTKDRKCEKRLILEKNPSNLKTLYFRYKHFRIQTYQ